VKISAVTYRPTDPAAKEGCVSSTGNPFTECMTHPAASWRASDHIAADSINWHNLNEICGRGSPSLVGRGIANPMSVRTRGFETLLFGSAKFPLPAPSFLKFVRM